MKTNRPLVGVFVWFCGGIWLAKYIHIPYFYLYCLSALTLIFAVAWSRTRKGSGAIKGRTSSTLHNSGKSKESVPTSGRTVPTSGESNKSIAMDTPVANRAAKATPEEHRAWREKAATLSLYLCVLLVAVLFYNLSESQPSNHIKNFTPKRPSMVYVEGAVKSDPQVTIGRYHQLKSSFVMSAKRLKASGAQPTDFGLKPETWHRLEGKVLVTVYGFEPALEYGDGVVIRGELLRPKGAKAPGEFDYSQYLGRQKIYSLLLVKKGGFVELIEKGETNPIFRFVFRIKKRLREVIRINLPSLEAKILSAILLGERSQIPRFLNDRFVETGTVHVLAISGLHVGVVAFLLIGILKLLRLPRRASFFFAVILLILYAVLTGARPPIVRATIMASILLLGLAIGRDADTYNSLAASGLILLAARPFQLFDAGFQLSFIAVASILFLSPGIEGILWPGKVKRDLGLWPSGPMVEEGSAKSKSKALLFLLQAMLAKVWVILRKAISVSLAAWLGILPIVAYNFKIISPVTVVANLLVIPIVTLVVASGIIFLSLSFIFPSNVFGLSCNLFVKLLMGLINIISNLPYGFFRIEKPHILFIGVYYILLFYLAWNSKVRRALPALEK